MTEIVAKEPRHQIIGPENEMQHIRRKKRNLLGMLLHDDLDQDRLGQVFTRLAVTDFNRLAGLHHLLDFLQRNVFTFVTRVIATMGVALDQDFFKELVK